MVRCCCLFMLMMVLQGCVHKIVTVPIKTAYKTTKYAVKGTVAVAGLAIPDGHELEDKD